MCGWHNKAYCLYEYFMSVIQVDFAKKDYKRMRKSIEINRISNLELNIIFNNGKEKSYTIIKNNKLWSDLIGAIAIFLLVFCSGELLSNFHTKSFAQLLDAYNTTEIILPIR